MRNSPFTKLLLAIIIFLAVVLVLAHFRHGLNILMFPGILIGTLVSIACLDKVIWRYGSNSSPFRRFLSFYDFVLAGLLMSFFALSTFDIKQPSWLVASFLILCVPKIIYLWLGQRRSARSKSARDLLQMQMFDRNRSHDV